MRKIILLILAAAWVLPAVAEEQKNTWKSPGVPAASSDFWKTPAGEPPKVTGVTPLPASPEIQNKADWTLADLIDFALQTGYETKASWNDAKAAAAEFASKKGAYYPEVDLLADLSRTKGSAIGGQFTFKQDSLQPAALVNFVLFDFGKRSADVDEARKALLAADYLHNAAIQNLILQVQQAYYGYIGSKSLLQAQEASIQSAQTALDAARQRHDAGLATIADVLQAQTALAEADFAAATTRGIIQILRGTLAIAIGFPPAKAKFEVVDQLPMDLPLDSVSTEVFTMISEGFARRPDLAAARAEALKAEAHVRSLQAERFPIVEFNGSVQRLYYLDPDTHSNNYSASLSIAFPLFDGFSRKNDVIQAKAEAEAVKARVTSAQQQVALQIWTSYFLLTTSAERIKTTRKVLETAQESYDVASGRYKEGVGSILDVLAAQSALEDARAQDVRNRTEWFLSLAQLNRNMGTLGLSDENKLIFRNDGSQDVNQ